MRVLITGMNGTVAPVLAETLAGAGVECVAWNRQQVPVDDELAANRFLSDVAPDAVCHLAMGAEAWAALLARHCQEHGLGFLFTSTAMVFDAQPNGPHRVDDERTSRDAYGRYKIRCEDAIRGVSDRAIIARIGWQIGSARTGNQMAAALHDMNQRDGQIAASTRWLPATSLLPDTAAALWQLLKNREPGTFHVDSNAECGLNFCEIVTRLEAQLAADWVIRPSEDYVHDQRLLDHRVSMPRLDERF